jgi:hypothetical protein
MTIPTELPVVPEAKPEEVKLPPGTFKLPEDLELIVKAFSKPVFVHWRLFKDAKKVVPKRHWADLEEALSAPKPDKVCDTVNAYIDVCRKLLIADTELNNYRDSIGDFGTKWCAETRTAIVANLTPEQLTDRGRLSLVCHQYRGLQFKAYRALLVEMHGEAVVEYAEYLDKRRERYGWNVYSHPLTLKNWDEVDGYYEDA